MSIKGFPSSQKLDLGTADSNNFVTVQPVDDYRYALDTVARGAYVAYSDIMPLGESGVIDGQAWVYFDPDVLLYLYKGDIYKRPMDGVEHPIVRIDWDNSRFLIGGLDYDIASWPYNILRSTTQKLGADGSVSVTTSASPIQTKIDGQPVDVNLASNGADTRPLAVVQVDSQGHQWDPALSARPIAYKYGTGNQEVKIDPFVPGNSSPLPVGLYSTGTGNYVDPETLATKEFIGTTNGILSTISGKIPLLGQKNMAGSSPVVIASDQSTLPTSIKSSDGVKIVANSTTTPLGSGGIFIGTWTDAISYSAIQLGVHADQNSASLGVEIQFSHDGVSVDHYHQYTYEASSNGVGYTFQPEFQYFRIKYTNGSVAQTSFSLMTVIKATALFPSQYRVEQAITGQSQALVTKGVIYGLTTGGGGGYVAAKVNPSGALNVAATQDTSPWVVSGTITANAGTDLNTSALAVENGGNLETLVAQGASEYNLNTLTVSGLVIIDVNEKATLSFSTTGTWSGSIGVLGGINGVYTNIYFYKTSTRDAYQNFNSNTIGVIDCAGFQTIMFVGSGFSGTATIETFGNRQTGAVVLSGSLPSGVNVIGSVGSIVNALPTGNNVIGSVMQNGTWNIGSISNALPGGSNTLGSIKLTDGTNTAAVKAASTAAVATDPALVVAISPNNVVTTVQGAKDKVNQIYNDYSVTGVTTSAYVQVLASTAAASTLVEVFDSSGEALILAVGGAGSEVNQFYIVPGGNGRIPLAIPSGSRISVKALTADVSSGFLIVNLYA